MPRVADLLFTLIYLTALILPGLLIARLFKISQQLLLFSISFSLAYFVSVLAISIHLNLSVNNFYVLYGLGFGALIICAKFTKNSPVVFDNNYIPGILIILIGCGIYLYTVGMYDELPSDVYAHLEYFNQIVKQINSGSFNSASGSELFSKYIRYWYHLPVLTSYITNTDFIDHVEIYSAINVVLILACVYEFTHWIFKGTIINKSQLMITSLLSVLFFVLHFGINVFSYIRYYAIAPTILNYCIYLTSIVCLLNYYHNVINFKKFILISSLLFSTAYLIHAQESLFIGIIYCLVTAIIFIQIIYHKINRTHQSKLVYYRNTVLLILPLLILLTVVSYFYLTQNLNLSLIASSKVITLSKLIDYGDNLLILNPYQQFYTVMTHWGLLIYLIYIFCYKHLFSHQPVLLAGMLVPIVTVFNPLFTEMFLRISNSNLLWRFLYMLPLYIVAARIVTGLYFSINLSALKKSLNYLIILMVFIFLLPINTSVIKLPYSRIYSLFPVHYQARASYWQDMLDYLQTLPDQETIITDPVTGYMISALTQHRNRRHKFYRSRMTDPFEFDDYSQQPLKQYNGKIFIINQRKGISTPTAKIARHWSPDNLKLTDFYSQKLIDHIFNDSEHFKLLWHTNDIKIYRITY